MLSRYDFIDQADSRLSPRAVIEGLEQRILLSGASETATGSGLATVLLWSSDIYPIVNESVTVRAKVVPATPGAPAPTGMVSFLKDGVEFDTSPLTAAGIATSTFAFTALQPQRSSYLSAIYSGDSAYTSAQTHTAVFDTVFAPSQLKASISARVPPKPVVAGKSILMSPRISITNMGDPYFKEQ